MSYAFDWRPLPSLLVAAATVGWFGLIAAAEDATSSRVPWTSSRIVGSPEPPRPYRVERVFKNLHFTHPVVVTMDPGFRRWYVAEQDGKIFSFRDDPAVEQADLFLDAKELLKKEPAESPAKAFEAVYGLTFHPQFESNRYCYVCYVLRGQNGNEQLPEGTRVSRFEVSRTDPPRALPETEQILLTWMQGGHNGGCLKFGPDGMLYISTGDAGPAFPPDIHKAGQDLSNLLSAILRIDVNQTTAERPYAIPPDNPFAKLPGARGEIWSYGYRNPWKMSFDRATGDLWVGDVGWELWELAIRTERGGNYGWSIVEGPQSVHVDRPVGPTPILPPALAIPHTDGVSITGGFVYRGQRFPELVGQYVFGDWETRRIWAGRWDGKQLIDRRDLVDPEVRVVDFAEDRDGELYALDYDAGTLHAFVAQAAVGELPPFPPTLAASGLFASVPEHTPAPGVIPFTVNVEQWCDGATAERLVGIPGTGCVTVFPTKRTIPGSMFSSSLQFPPGSVLAKTLSLEMERGRPESRRKIETQLLHFDGRFWNAYSYAWQDDQSDAVLVSAEGTTREFMVRDSQAPDGLRRHAWRFSSRVECARCHNQWAEYALGFNVRQLHRHHGIGASAENQLETLVRQGLIRFEPERADARPAESAGSAPPALDQLPRLADPFDPSADLAERARSYLHVNCAHCHRNGGGGTSYIELQQELSLRDTKTLGARPTQGTFGIADAQVIAPGDPYRSVLYFRMAKMGAGRMPHLGSNFVDEPAVRLIGSWIDSIAAEEEHPTVARTVQLAAPHLAAAASALRASPPDPLAAKASLTQLLESPPTALWLARQLAESEMLPALRELVVSLGTARDDPAVRDLFEPYLPESQRVRRLGTAVSPTSLLSVKGDAERGRRLFWESTVLNCKNCHQIGGKGGRVGPDLSQVGKKYTRGQLLEQILEPSKTIDPKYQTSLVTTSSGRVMTGVLLERSAAVIVLRDAKDAEARVAVQDVEQISTLSQSLMPEQLLRDLTAAQAADLLAYLESLRP